MVEEDFPYIFMVIMSCSMAVVAKKCFRASWSKPLFKKLICLLCARLPDLARCCAIFYDVARSFAILCGDTLVLLRSWLNGWRKELKKANDDVWKRCTERPSTSPAPRCKVAFVLVCDYELSWLAALQPDLRRVGLNE